MKIISPTITKCKTQLEPPKPSPSMLYLAKAAHLAYSCAEKTSLQITHFSGVSTQAIVLGKDDNLVISFRGTELCVADLKADLDFRKIYVPSIGMVHGGFCKALEEVLGQIMAFIEKHQSQKPSTKLFIVGHSLGGALAVLLAAHLNACQIPFEQVLTLGQPRVFGRKTAKYHQKQWGEKLVRVVNYNDPVPYLPFLIQGYDHIGKVLFFDGYTHPHFEVSIAKRIALVLLDLGIKLALAMYPKVKVVQWLIAGLRRHRIEAYIAAIENCKAKFPKVFAQILN